MTFGLIHESSLNVEYPLHMRVIKLQQFRLAGPVGHRLRSNRNVSRKRQLLAIFKTNCFSSLYTGYPWILHSIHLQPANSSHFGTKAYIFLRVRTEQCQICVLPVKLFSLSKSCHFSALDRTFKETVLVKVFPMSQSAKCCLWRTVIGRDSTLMLIVT